MLHLGGDLLGLMDFGGDGTGLVRWLTNIKSFIFIYMTFPFSPPVETAQVKAFCKSGQTVNEAVVRRGNASVPWYFPAGQESVDRALALLDESNDCLEHRNWDVTVGYKSRKGSWIDGMIILQDLIWGLDMTLKATLYNNVPGPELVHCSYIASVWKKYLRPSLQICWGFGRHHQGANFQTEILGLKGRQQKLRKVD